MPTFSRRFDHELQASVVALGRVETDRSAFRTRFEPGHPADPKGEVRMPNVNTLVETVDMREASRCCLASCCSR